MMTNDTAPSRRHTPQTKQVMVALRRIIRAIDLHSRALVQQYGLTGPQLIVLKELQDASRQAVGELARAVHLSQATVTGILDRLEKKGLIVRTRSNEDKRKVEVAVTADATQVISEAPPLLQEHFIAAFSTLPDWEQLQILSSLQRIVTLMEARDLDATPMLATGPIDASSEQTEEFLQQLEPPNASP